MSALPKRFFTAEEYLELECKAEYKSQYVAGEIFAMAGAQALHDKITGNIFAGLHRRFRNLVCDVFTSDMRVCIPAGDMYTYPDVSALCGEPKFETNGNPPSLLNPQVIFEVLSASTHAFDRGDKFSRYRRLDSLTDYVLVSTDRMRVEHHAVQPSGVWKYEESEHPSNRLRLASVDCEVPLEEIYDKVAFSETGRGSR